MTQNKGKAVLLLNTVSSLILQLVSLVAGFVLPRLIMSSYGSEINGMLQSINQFVGLITLMQLGLGAVIQTAFYAPLYKEDKEAIGAVYSASNRIFRNIALYYFLYIVVVMFAYPNIVGNVDDAISVSTLVLILSFGLLAQYYWGLTNQLLLWADQRGFVYASLQSIGIVLSTVLSVLLMRNSYSIHVVKLASSIVFLIPVVGMHFYVRRNYKMIKPKKVKLSVIPQRFNGTAQHLASIAINSIDIIILTFMLGLSEASVYSVYYMIAYSLRLLVMAASNGLQSMYGRYWASDKVESMSKLHAWSRRLFNVVSLLIFLPTGFLITDFVSVYTTGITDVLYVQHQLGIVIVLAQYLYCMQIPQTMLIKSANMYRETQHYYLIEAFAKVLLSILFVHIFGITGVAIGSIMALVMRNAYLRYKTKSLLPRTNSIDYMELLLFFSTMIVTIISVSRIGFTTTTYFQWLVKAIIVVMITVVSFLLLSLIIKGKKYIRSIVRF